MIRSTVKKVMWVGRATVFMVGLAVILAMVVGLASAAYSATGGNLILGQSNSADAPTTLVGQIVDTTKSALVLKNPNGGSALQLQVNSGQAPLKVNATAGKATNLNADKVDGREASSFANVAHAHAGEEITSGTVAELRIDGSIARDAEVMDTVKANDGPGSGLDADTLDGKQAADFYGQGSKVADSDRLDGYDSRNFGISTLQSANSAHNCDTASAWNQCAPVTFTNLDPGKTYIATVWSSFSAKARGFSSREVSYCAGMSGLPSPTPCLTAPLNKVRVHDYFTAASASAVEYPLTGASSYTFFTAINPSGEFEVATDTGVITTAMIRRADGPLP
jgi:hypothetical protein